MTEPQKSKALIRLQRNLPAKLEGLNKWIDIASVIIPKHKELSEEKMRDLQQSISQISLLHPISVVRHSSSKYLLVAGRHRLEACKRKGLKQIPAMILPNDPLHIKLAEIDENLLGPVLSALERAEYLEEKRQIYEKLYPVERAE